MPLTTKEIKESVGNLEIDPHFEVRSKVRNITIEKIKYYLENDMPNIEETGKDKYKLTYQIDKVQYLVLYVIRLPKGLKMLTCFIERIRK